MQLTLFFRICMVLECHHFHEPEKINIFWIRLWRSQGVYIVLSSYNVISARNLKSWVDQVQIVKWILVQRNLKSKEENKATKLKEKLSTYRYSELVFHGISSVFLSKKWQLDNSTSLYFLYLVTKTSCWWRKTIWERGFINAITTMAQYQAYLESVI